jgi:integrase
MGNPERKTLYQLCWHLGASQGDIANLKGEDVDWTSNTVSFTRQKSGVAVLVHLGAEALNVFKDLPAEGVLFPYLSRVRAGDRATEFGQRCRQLGITGITLHSYRYAWAERAKTAGSRAFVGRVALRHGFDQCVAAEGSQLRGGHELAARHRHSAPAMACHPLQGETCHHP